MRRLIQHLRHVRVVHGEDSERGATAVITAFSLVVLLGFAAIVIDVGMLYQERAELQSGADAAALAVAQDCAAGRATCSTPSVVAQTLADANAKDGTARVVESTAIGGVARVVLSTREQDGAGTLALAFAPLFGIDSAAVSASASARWSNPKSGPAILPIALSPCDFHLDGGLQVLRLHGSNGSTTCNIKSTSGANLPGGFGLVKSPTGSCSVEVTTELRLDSDTGNSIPNVCKDVLEGLKSATGRTVLLPLYDDLGGTGNNGWYRLKGWAAFRIVGWRFPSTEFNNTDEYKYKNKDYDGATCENPCTGLIGEFVRFATLDDFFEAGGPNLGAGLVELTE